MSTSIPTSAPSVVVLDQAANQPLERARVLLSGRIELVVGQFRLSGRGRHLRAIPLLLNGGISSQGA